MAKDPSARVDPFVSKLIADLRAKLLDLRNSNKLLSYKHSERSKTQVRIVDEQPDFLHECLISGEKSLSFRSLPDPQAELPDEQDDVFLTALDEARRIDTAWVALASAEEDIMSDQCHRLDREIRDRVRAQLGLPPAKPSKVPSVAEWARLNGIEPSFDLPLPANGIAQAKHSDGEIQTLLLPDPMQGKLAGLLDHARTAQQEMGINLLHVAIGFLEWYESSSTDRPMLAPLLLYPVELERKQSRGRYRYSLRGEQEPVINITLRQRLAQDHNLVVPNFDMEDGDTAEKYMARMAKVIAEMPRWRVRRFATVGLFSFSRLVMYNDLDPALWGGEPGLPAAGVLGDLSRFSHQPVGNGDLRM